MRDINRIVAKIALVVEVTTIAYCYTLTKKNKQLVSDMNALTNQIRLDQIKAKVILYIDIGITVHTGVRATDNKIEFYDVVKKHQSIIKSVDNEYVTLWQANSSTIGGMNGNPSITTYERNSDPNNSNKEYYVKLYDFLVGFNESYEKFTLYGNNEDLYKFTLSLKSLN